METAKSSNWKTKDLPVKRVTLRLNKDFSIEEMQYIKKGLIPIEMEDKWFIYWENNNLFFHRSWTGYCMYIAHFIVENNEYRMVSVDVNREPEQYTEINDNKDIGMVLYFIDVLLLHKEANYPSNEPYDDKESLKKWSQIGRAMLGQHPNEGNDVMELPEKLKKFIQHEKWIFAKTYAKTWPHEYIVQEQVDQELFIELSNHIDKFGYEDSFSKMKQIYFKYDNLIYWHMENIINRCEEKDTYQYREKMGRLPEDKRK